MELHYPRIWKSLAWLGVAATVYLSLTPRPPDLELVPRGDLWGHFLAYGLLAWWSVQAFGSRNECNVGMGLVAMGLTLELIQGLSGYRTFDLLDFAADVAGVGVGLKTAKHLTLLPLLDRHLVRLRS